jgi:hypothetical protein
LGVKLKLDRMARVRELRHLDSARFNPYDLLHPVRIVGD